MGTTRVVLFSAAVAGVLFTEVAPAQSSPRLSPFARRKAERLLRDQLPCLGCHALGGEGGRLAPELLSVRQRRSAEYIAAIVDDPQRVVPRGLMPKTSLPASTRDLVVQYLQLQEGNGSTPPGPSATTAPLANDGASLYERWCAGCHGVSGRGNGPNASFLPQKPTAHADAALMRARSDDALFDTIAGGGAIMNRSPRMPAFGATLTSAQIRALVLHIRALCGCGGPPWSRS